jgi:hypothetical protein
MRRSFAVLVIAAAACCCATPVIAQTKVAGTMACGKPDPQQMALGTDKSKHGQSTETVEVSGNKAQARGRHVTTMQSVDKVFVWYQGTTTTKDGAPLDSKGTWAYTGGTGKLHGIEGKGSYACSPWAGGLGCDIEGEYQLAK